MATEPYKSSASTSFSTPSITRFAPDAIASTLQNVCKSRAGAPDFASSSQRYLSRLPANITRFASPRSVWFSPYARMSVCCKGDASGKLHSAKQRTATHQVLFGVRSRKRKDRGLSRVAQETPNFLPDGWLIVTLGRCIQIDRLDAREVHTRRDD